MSNETSSSTTATPTANSLLVPSLLNIQHSISIKLTSANYLLWLAQFQPFLRINDSLGYADGTNPCPAATIPNSCTTINPAYTHWQRQDQIVLSWILSSLTESVLAHVVGLKTSHEVWSSLANQYSSKSQSRVRQLKMELQHLRKGNNTMSQYFLMAKQLADNLLLATGNGITDADLQYQILSGLDPNYEAIVTVFLNTVTTNMSMDDFYVHLLSFDKRLEAQNALSSASSALVARNMSRMPQSSNNNNNNNNGQSNFHGKQQGYSRRNMGGFNLLIWMLALPLLSSSWWCPIQLVSGEEIYTWPKHVFVKNDLSAHTPVTLHCKSKDDDLGERVLQYNQQFDWTFRVNLLLTTHFWCDMLWYDDYKRPVQGTFDIYVVKRDYPRCEKDCCWSIRKDALYSSSCGGNWQLMFYWPYP